MAAGANNLQDWLDEKVLKKVYVLETYTNKINIIPITIKFYFIEKQKIKEAFKDIQFDIVLKPFFHFWSEIIAAQVSKNKIVTLCHDPIMHSGESYLKHILYTSHIKKSDEVFVLTRRFIPIVAENYGFSFEHIHYMPHGLLTKYKKVQRKDMEIPYKEGKVNFLFFGRIEEYKGIGTLVEAYNILLKKYANITLTIAGKGNIQPYIDKIKGIESIHIVNTYIPDDEVGCYFEGSNIVAVLPYLDATQSGVIPIAIEYGVPVIASDTGGLREQLQDGDLGLFAKPGDAQDLASKMEMFVINNSLYAMENQAMLKVAKELHWGEIVAKYFPYSKRNGN